ncbi:MAG: hypothetical protein OXU26_06620, partial [Acidobacteriota bacterium]|nr:hypothetical protein [Acidobacteriota bacterium]
MRLGEKGFLTTKSTKVTSCVFVPFVAIPGKPPAAEIGKRLNSSFSLFETPAPGGWEPVQSHAGVNG